MKSNWKVIRASVIGTSHQENNSECQDCCWADRIEINDKDYLVAIVSDGAGSALKGAKGSELACEILIKSITASIKQQNNSLSEANIIPWIKAIRKKIGEVGKENHLTPRDYACTLLCAIIAENSALFFQIGDGAMVISQSNHFSTVFWPDSGEYANSTYFVTDNNAFDNLRISKIETKINEIALFSDGLQHLALSYDSKLPHTPFFEPMFKILRNRKETNCDDLDEQLKTFLNSKAINARTDDDKTLVLASR